MSQQKRGTGWIITSGILLVLAGVSMINLGAWALHANDTVQNSTGSNLLFSSSNVDTWGWIYLIVGLVVAVAGFGVFLRAQWAVWVGILAATVSMAFQFFWLFTPQWPAALVTIALDGIVIVGLSSYGLHPVEPGVPDQS